MNKNFYNNNNKSIFLSKLIIMEHRRSIFLMKLPLSSAHPRLDLFSIIQPYQSAAEEVRKQRESLQKEKDDWRKEQQKFMEQFRREKKEYRREREAAMQQRPWYPIPQATTPMNPTAPMGPSQPHPGYDFTSSVNKEWQNMYSTAPPRPSPSDPANMPHPSGWTLQQAPWTPLWTNATNAPPGEPIRYVVAKY